jgi:hypothetical protein
MLYVNIQKENQNLSLICIKYKNSVTIRTIPRGKAKILGGHSISHSNKKKKKYVHVSYCEQFPRETYFTAQQYSIH